MSDDTADVPMALAVLTAYTADMDSPEFPELAAQLQQEIIDARGDLNSLANGLLQVGAMLLCLLEMHAGIRIPDTLADLSVCVALAEFE